MTATDAGEYRCEVHNQIGLGRSPPVVITVLGYGRCQYLSPGLVAGISVASLVLIVLVSVGACYLLRRRWRQAAQGGAELSHKPEAEPIYENVQRPCQDIYSQLDYSRAGSR
ncbi:TYRO protein tyrosine kinase-binding protein-like [Emydura macquarii macquarii]|uniref:TYRO protein tyrosine kinase-binding protein-like n=1 Tax=Emydura macquarii macquarii TaxID=1129001 RepID=UPI00352B70BE